VGESESEGVRLPGLARSLGMSTTALEDFVQADADLRLQFSTAGSDRGRGGAQMPLANDDLVGTWIEARESATLCIPSELRERVLAKLLEHQV
jgi:hypothetical protein